METGSDLCLDDFDRLRNILQGCIVNCWPREEAGRVEDARRLLKDCSQTLRQKLTKPFCKRDFTYPGLLYDAIDSDAVLFIEFLVKECDADLEEKYSTNSIQSSVHLGNSPETFTPLGYAVILKKEHSIRALVSLDADVNVVSPTTGLSLLHFACSENKFESFYGQQTGLDTPMMIDHNKKADICRLLLLKGANINATDEEGNSALHYAVLENSTVVIKLLLEHGANPYVVNKFGADTFLTVCFDCRADLIDVFYQNYSHSARKLMESYLVTGAAAVLCRNRDMALAADKWMAAMTLREQHPEIDDDEEDFEPNPAYGGATVIKTLAQLNQILNDESAMFLQGVLLTDKILGSLHIKTIESVLTCALRFVRNGQYGRGLRLYKYGFILCREHWLLHHDEFTYLKLLERCCLLIGSDDDVDYEGIKTRRVITFEDVFELLETVVLEARRVTADEVNSPCTLRNERSVAFILMVIFLTLWFLRLETNELESLQFKKLIYRFVRLDLKESDGTTVLMRAINVISWEDFGSFRLKMNAIKLILECGAEINQADDSGNCVLFMLKITCRSLRNNEARQVAEMLLSAGAHPDRRNAYRAKVICYLRSLGLNPLSNITLKCFAARVIRRHKVPYTGKIPKSLADFVEMH